MTKLAIVLQDLNAAHTAKRRDEELVNKLFTVAQNMGARLMAYNYSTASTEVEMTWNTKADNKRDY